MLISCSEVHIIADINDEKIISRTVYDMETLSSENGEKKQLLRSPIVEEHAFAKPAYEEYPQGVEAIIYDSLGRPSSRIVADYALHWTERDMWELKGNVFAEGDNGAKKYYTQQLFWDRKTKKIWSNVDSKIEDGNDVYTPERFEALDDFLYYRFGDFTGTMSVSIDSTETTPADSTSVAPNGGPIADTLTLGR